MSSSAAAGAAAGGATAAVDAPVQIAIRLKPLAPTQTASFAPVAGNIGGLTEVTDGSGADSPVMQFGAQHGGARECDFAPVLPPRPRARLPTR